QALTRGVAFLAVQRSQQALAGLLVECELVGALGQVVLDVLMAGRKLAQQIGGGVEVRYHFALIGIQPLLQLIHLVLCAVWRASELERVTSSDPDGMAGSRKQPGREVLFHECSSR